MENTMAILLLQQGNIREFCFCGSEEGSYNIQDNIACILLARRDKAPIITALSLTISK